MTRVYITIDTEYSSGLVRSGSPDERADNYARSIACVSSRVTAGLPHALARLQETGQSAVFFVDPMPALLWGTAAIEDIVAPILDAGQDVQLHLHTEWLQWAGDHHPLASRRTGQNLFEFAFEDQCTLIEYARSQLIAAGAPAPVAFRAGNYGANDDTLRALATLGMEYDTSHCPALAGSASRLSLGPDDRSPLFHNGVIEVPVGSIEALGGGAQRHAQITALSFAELSAAIVHARDTGQDSLTLVSHSFEFFSREKRVAKRIVQRRFDRLCAFLRDTKGVASATYRYEPPRVRAARTPTPLLPASALRTGARMVEQAVSNALYGTR
ncbi:MAG: hypothetical protein QNI87_10890 [Erythrobacter sp.]|uniref:hypothetical protein n=1 Tax=Erythrobacter sp. TaxID=1042 RepID=UPI00260501BF|nr:hypothetical protein [Erythrobacter sp.]MDJ0979026.1 hypothetical protein [Erythrobacter sp.]